MKARNGIKTADFRSSPYGLSISPDLKFFALPPEQVRQGKPMYCLQLARLLTLIFAVAVSGTVAAQDTAPADGNRDDSSQRTDESEEAYRRRMELEGARNRDTFANQSYASSTEQEALDKLPEKSQKNIRDQITDIIIENDRWEPSDALSEYPYEPTEAAMKDPVLLEQEEEAWAEQVQKYHEREAAAFGATRPPMPGNGEQQAGAGSSGEGQQQGNGSGESGQDGMEDSVSDAGSAGGYSPYPSPNRGDSDEMSTAGVSESALDFLRGKQGQPRTSGSIPQGQLPDLAEGSEYQQPGRSGSGEEPQGDPSGESMDTESAGEQAPDGSLPIEQLKQLQGIAGLPAPEQPASPTSPGESPPVQSADAADANASSETDAAGQQRTAQDNQQEQQENQTAEQTSPDLDLDTPGIIAIRDLEKLEGVEEPPEPAQPQ